MNASILESIKYHLEGLKRTPDGGTLYQLIARGLKHYGGEDGKLEHAFLSFLHNLLERYAKDPKGDPATRVKARLIQQRLALFLPQGASAATPTAKSIRPPSAPQTEGISRWTKIDAMTARPPASPAPEPAPKAAAKRRAPEPAKPAAPPPVTEAVPPPSPAPAVSEESERLAETLTKTLAADEAFETALTSIDAQSDGLDTAIRSFDDLKQLLVRGLDELMRERQALRQKLSKVGEYMKAVEADRKRLKTELGHARANSLADNLTGLPKREVFTRQLEAEIGRVKRYGFALSVALIDVDGLETVNERYGREAGDAVLRCYATEILAHFRAYDLVARYGEDEFAVMFPNTQKDGATTALEKARKNAAQTFISHEGRSIPLPTFSSVLTLYSPGEQPVALLRRAGDALMQAKRQGTNRQVVALPSA